MNKLFTYIFYFSILSILGFFFANFIFQIGDQYILSNIATAANSSYTSLGISVPMQTYIETIPISYRNQNIPYDLFFITSFISMFSISVITAYKSREESYASFFGAITIGLMIFLFATGFISIIIDWIVLNLIQNLLSFDLNTTPIILFYIENIGIINFIWAVILIIVNKLTFSVIRSQDDTDIADFSNPNQLNNVGRFDK